MESRGSRGRSAFLTTIGILVALALVAVASRGSTPAGTGGARGPAQTLVDIVFTLYVLTLVAAAMLLIYLLVLQRQIEAETRAVLRRRRLETVLTVILLAGVSSLLARKIGGADPLRPPEAPDPIFPGAPLPETVSSDGNAYEAEFAWLPVLVTVALIFLALGAWWLGSRARRRARGELPEALLAGALVAAVEESLDDIRAEADPRRAVIAAYARLERVLAAHDLARRASEAPLEYLGRILDELAVGAEAVKRLTVLFERAKFSQHAVGPEMKEEAIAALENVRGDLLAARARAEQARQEALAAYRERPT